MSDMAKTKNKVQFKDIRITIRIDAATLKCLKKIEGTLPETSGKRRTSIAVREAIVNHAAEVGC